MNKQLNARDFVDALDNIIKGRVMQGLQTHVELGQDDLGPLPGGPARDKDVEEKIELEKRKMTDYLLSTDPRHGYFVEGKDQ